MSKNKKENRYFVRFYNGYYMNGQYKLSPKQWYMLSLVAVDENRHLLYTKTNINLLSQQQTIFNFNAINRNKKSTSDVVNELIDLGVIVVLNTEKYGYDDLLHIKIVHMDTGYEEIDYETLIKIDDVYELYLVSVLHSHKRGFSKSMSGIAELLGIGIPKAKSIIDSLKSKGMIKTDRNISRSDDGTFTSTPYKFYLTLEETQVQDVPKSEEKPTVQPEPVLIDGQEARQHQWYEKGKGIRFDEYDFYVYETTTDQELKKIANQKIKTLENLLNNDTNKKAWDYIESLWEQSKIRVIREQREKEAENRKGLLNLYHLIRILFYVIMKL